MAHAIASSLNSLNKHRQKLTEIALEEAEKQLTEKYPLIFVSGRNWNEGIIGLVAGKLMEKYHKPAIVVKEGEKIAKGSARSIKHFNIVDALHTFSGYILQFGGHEMAAGFTTTTDRLKPLKQSLLQFSAKTISEEHLIRELFIDDEISANEIDFNLTTLLNRVEPTGYMNPTPLFKIGPLRVIKVYAIGQESRHIKIFLLDPSTNKTLEGVWFDPPADAFAIREGDKIIIAGSIGEEEWNNHRKIQIKIKDIKIES
jgi:single-stranded-DNA-specific exonuclease